ncbi:MAG TPA: hypothetical protein VK158_01990 [Acidobacteriota bacterium]|nr:hypothetical protein [Acidobacteriota bacterium]
MAAFDKIWKSMAIIFVLLLVVYFTFAIIKHNKINTDIEAELEKNPWIHDLLTQQGQYSNYGGFLTKCYYNDQPVYYARSQCCDRLDFLYDQSGNAICSPSGGITGTGDGKCPDYFTKMEHCVVLLTN